jgi:uroporphyrinogen-III synthase
MQMSDKALSDLNVLLTRPEAQSAALVAAIHALGGHACELPLIKIEPVTAPDVCERIKACILNLDHYCAAIFISTNAAKIGMQWIDRFWPQLPAGLIAYAVGPGTAQVLRNFDWPVVMSDRGVTSEDLLALTGLQKVEGKKIALFRGVGGRELLAETLRARGATVDYLELYYRHTPDYSWDFVGDLIRDQRVNVVVVSSAQILDVLLHSLHQDVSQLDNIPLIVPSERVRQQALDAGLTLVINAGGADEMSVIRSLRAIAPTIKPNMN